MRFTRCKEMNYLSKELTSLFCSSCQLSTEDQEKDQVSEKSGQKMKRGERKTAKPQERRKLEEREEDQPDMPRVQMVAPGDSIWVFTHMEPNLGILHCQCPGSTKEQIQQSTLPPSIIETNTRLLKQRS